MKKIRSDIFGQRRIRQLAWTLVICFMVIGIVIVPVETQTGNIKTVGDGMWWAVTTISGVGYGDLYPVTLIGRLLGSVLQFIGVITLGLIIGIVTHTVSRRQEEIFWSREFERFNQIEKRLTVMEKHLQYLIRERFEIEEKKEQAKQEAELEIEEAPTKKTRA